MVTKLLSYLRLLPWVIATATSLALIGTLMWPDTTPNYFSSTPRRAYVAPQSKLLDGVTATPTPQVTKVYKPTKKQAARIEKKLGFYPEGEILAISEVEKLEEGGTVVVTSVPSGEEDPSGSPVMETRVSVVEAKKKRFKLNLRDREVSFYVGGETEGNFRYLGQYRQGLIKINDLNLNTIITIKENFSTSPEHGPEVWIGVSYKF